MGDDYDDEMYECRDSLQDKDGYCVNFEVSGDSLEILKMASKCLFSSNLHKNFFYYGVLEDENSGDLLILCATKVTYKDQKLTRLPFPLKTPDAFYNFVKEWLNTSNKGEYYDSDCYPGFTIKLDDNNMWNGVVLVEHHAYMDGK